MRPPTEAVSSPYSTVLFTNTFLSLTRNWIRFPVPVLTSKSWSPSLSKSAQVPPWSSPFLWLIQVRPDCPCHERAIAAVDKQAVGRSVIADEQIGIPVAVKVAPGGAKGLTLVATPAEFVSSVNAICADATAAPMPSTKATIPDSTSSFFRRRMFNVSRNEKLELTPAVFQRASRAHGGEL